ncbi:MAG: Lrp/AsnC family transcriptional regulator [Candidatus Woesearchaeota archaeon]
MKLLETDKLILEYLYYDCRLSSNELAKIIGLKQSSVYMRIKKLEESGFIQSYDAVFDWSLFSFSNAMYFCDLSAVQLAKIMKSPFSFTVQKVYGMFDYQIIALFRNSEDKKSFEKMLPDTKVHSAIEDVGGLYGAIFDKTLKQKYLHTYKKGLAIKKFDTDDFTLLRALFGGGARKTLMQLSQETGLSIDTVKYRRKKFYDNHYFWLFFAQPGHAFKSIKLTYHVFNLHKPFPIAILKNKARLRMYTLSETSLVVVQISHSYNDFLIHQKVLFDLVKPYCSDIHSFVVEEPLVLNRLHEAFFSK